MAEVAGLAKVERNYKKVKSEMLADPTVAKKYISSFKTYEWSGELMCALEAMVHCQEVLNELEIVKLLIEAVEYAFNMLDARVRIPFSTIFKNAFLRLSPLDRMEALQYYFQCNPSCKPLNSKMYAKYTNELTEFMLSTNTFSATQNPETLADRLLWFLLVNPSHTLTTILPNATQTRANGLFFGQVLNMIRPLASAVDQSENKRLVILSLKNFAKKNFQLLLHSADGFFALVKTLCGDGPWDLLSKEEVVAEIVAPIISCPDAPPSSDSYKFAIRLGLRVLKN